MPTRLIREGWLESDPVDQLDAHAERFFLRLCLRVDDYGRYHANPQLLKSALFPLKEDVKGSDILRWIAACEKAGVVSRYEISGKGYLQIGKFDQRLRTKTSKFPPPDGNDGHMPDICPSYDGHPRTEEKGIRREAKQRVLPLTPARGEEDSVQASGKGSGPRLGLNPHTDADPDEGPDTIADFQPLVKNSGPLVKRSGTELPETTEPVARGRPTLERVVEHFRKAGAGYTEDEIRGTYLSFEAEKLPTGHWQWRKGQPLGDWRCAFEIRLGDHREKRSNRPHRSVPEKPAHWAPRENANFKETEDIRA